jgi:hypothetical protein
MYLTTIELFYKVCGDEKNHHIVGYEKCKFKKVQVTRVVLFLLLTWGAEKCFLVDKELIKLNLKVDGSYGTVR